MAVAMKGLLKGLRYISHIFEDGNEPEMQIGEPTDVKHVAHIGWDGPAASAPSWMDKFKSDGETVAPSPSQDSMKTGSESSVDESPSKRRVSRGMDSQPQPAKQSRKKKAKGSSRTSAKTKKSHVQESALEGG